MGRSLHPYPALLLAVAFSSLGIRLRLSRHYRVQETRLVEEARKLAEARRSERFELAVQGTEDGLWYWDLKSEVFDFSRSWAAMLGYEEAELEPNVDTWLSRVHTGYLTELRNEISKQLEHGKVDLSVYVESKNQETPVEINISLAKEYHKKIKALAKELKEPADDILYQVLKMPEVLKSERREPDENEWKEIKSVIDLAIKDLNKFRGDEGKSIEKDFTLRITNIDDCLEKIKNLDNHRIKNVKDRIRNNITNT